MKPLLLPLILTLLLLGPARADAAEPDHPNVLFIYLDDFGWKDTGFMGSDFYETPHLDRLAREGMIFTNAYSAAANCAPARAALLTGQYAPRHQIYNVGTRPRGQASHRRLLHVPGKSVLDPGIPTWARQVQKAGYVTAAMGKWHLSSDPRPYGFDINIGGSHSGSPPQGYYPPHPGVPGLQDAPNNEFLTTTLGRHARAFIAEHRDRPWFLYLSLFAVHTPLDANKELEAKYRAKPPGALHSHVPMATMIETVDREVGRLMETLTEHELTDKTAVVFFSDNGGYGPATDMAPLKGYKGTYYEGGIRVPFFVHWPGVVPPGTTNPTPIIGVDLFPTFLQMTGAAPAGQALDGRSLLPLFRGETLEERPLFWHFPAYLQSYADTGAWEQRDPLFRSRPVGVIRQGPWKLMEFFESGDLELYHLGNDIGETTNLANAHPDECRRLLETMRAWRRQTGAPVPTEPNPRFDADAEREAIARAHRQAAGAEDPSPEKR